MEMLARRRFGSIEVKGGMRLLLRLVQVMRNISFGTVAVIKVQMESVYELVNNVIEVVKFTDRMILKNFGPHSHQI